MLPHGGKLMVSPANIRLDWNVIARYKHSSLFSLIISDEGKKFYNIDTWIASSCPSAKRCCTREGLLRSWPVY
jgi:hypothetical protein